VPDSPGMDQDEVNEAEWAKAENWHGGFLGIYSSQLDSRTVVPKRIPVMGWTLNMAKPASRIFLGAILLVAAVSIVAGILRGS
jgi:uncharacterized membrane protein